ncbi:universal stress protein [Desulfobacca acetoxidans]|uniref:UspA domain-containing protein n=1 Tax=Desulfobacca acetoxidans (strain ATCC 700848 / DSM 11109 / ASRB2) TaxID=880072 RepID=F2NJH1_DESAR|nr:universal stress protein [Desulfobacca acetoxidans]AEB09483.1 UspA domain-containing protein [Desulfobacca acetoxidans DSM 11109]
MFKNILVFLDGGEESQRGLSAATSLVQQTGGRIRGLFVKKLEIAEIALMPPGHDLGAGSPVVIDPELLASMEAEQEAAARRLAELFATVAGPLASGLEVVRGDVVEELVQASHTADLVVMGRNRLASGNRTDWLSEITRSVLKRSWAPVLLPGSDPEQMLAGPFLLAYDASPAANRTLRQLTRLATLNQAPLTVLSVGPPETTTAFLEEARSYVCPYNLNVSFEPREGKPREVIQSVAGERRFSLIGLGAHGHSKLKDVVLGTTAEKMLLHLPQAFLICAR